MCDERLVDAPALGPKLRKLRFQGVNVSTLIQAFEEQYQIVPLELVTERWLLNACTQPQLLYIRKLKRAFDLAAASLLLLLLAPLCAVIAVIVKLSSPGPVIYRQTRCGKFGRPFQVFKFRSMRADAEHDGKARWWSKNDPRETFFGRWMRKYRIDEIPQLLNILRGEMSFVGPRPERPEFMDVLSKEVPFFMERTMLLPGLTGWAQVNYPYGSNVEDAARKMEFDIYYMKHMSLVLDVFIMLDTLRTVLGGGAQARQTGREALAGLGQSTSAPATPLVNAA
jgi:exopolysaccharide biosynthesis polyprenyl glycosylphosphotransferase